MNGETESIKSISQWVESTLKASNFETSSYCHGLFVAFELVLRDEIRLECIKQGLI
jgi:hypothetical protein